MDYKDLYQNKRNEPRQMSMTKEYLHMRTFAQFDSDICPIAEGWKEGLVELSR